MSGKGKPTVRLIRPLAKGQITLPIAFRRQLGINEETILSVAIKDGKIEIAPFRPAESATRLREYTAVEIARFLAEDRIDQKTATRVRRLLGKRSAA